MLAMKCEKTIIEILSRLDLKYENPEHIGDIEYECISSLSRLKVECSEALKKIGETLLDRSDESEDAEYKLQLVLQALVNLKHSSTLELVIKSLLSEKTCDKEVYIEILAMFKDPKVIPALMHTIESDLSTGVEEGLVRSKAIDLLNHLKAEEVALRIIPYVKDPAHRVRSVAIDFLVNLSIREASSIFAAQLLEEEDPFNLEKLISGLVSWKQADILPKLKELSVHSWVHNDRSLQTNILDAITKLEAINGNAN